MKTNKILMAVALPALLAACTAEEIVEQSPVANLGGRALLDPNFSVNVIGGAESRFAWEGYNWNFEDGDQFGAAVTDVATQGTVTGTSLIGNYIFSKNDAGNWFTDSQMSEGIYQYYSFDGFKTKMARELIAFDLTGQNTDLDEAEAELNAYENQLMISPLYTLQAKYSTEALPLDFYSYFGVGAFKFQNNSGQDLKITQIILNSETNMTVKGRVNPKAFEDVAEFVYNEEAGKYVLQNVDAAMKSYNKGNLTSKQKADAIENAEEAYENAIYKADASVAADPLKGDKESKFIALDCNNYLLEEGEVVTAYMMLPAGEAKKITVEIMVVDENGKAWSVYVDSNGNRLNDVDGYTNTPKAVKVTNLDKYEILRHKTNAIFGKTTDGEGMKTLEILDDNLVENTGYYVDNKKDLMKLLDSDLGDIKIHNSGDLFIDEDVVEAINEYTGAGVSFSNAIEIKSAKALTAENDLQLSGVEFAEVIIKGADEDEAFEGTEIELGTDVKAEKMIIEAGAVVALCDGNYATVENHGDLTVIANDAIDSRAVKSVGTIINKAGELTIKGAINPAITMEAGNLSYVTNKKANKYSVNNNRLRVAAGANVTIGEYVTMYLNKAMTIDRAVNTNNGYQTLGVASTWTNNGAIVMNEDLTVLGKLENNGIIEGDAKLTVGNQTLKQPTTAKPDNTKVFGAYVENAEGAEIMCEQVEIAKKSEVLNGGELGETQTLALVNEGLIVMDDFDARVTMTAGDGEIDNTAKGVVDAPVGTVIYARMQDMENLDELESYKKSTGINKLVIEGKWTVTEDKDYMATTPGQEDHFRLYKYDELVINTIVFDGGSLSVDEDLVMDFSKKDNEEMEGIEVIVAADTEWKGRSQKTSGVTGISSLTVDTYKENGEDVPYDFDIKNLNVNVEDEDGVQTLYGDYYFATAPTAETINAKNHKMILATADMEFGGKSVYNAVLTSLSEASVGHTKSVVKVSSDATFNNCEFAAPTTNYDIYVDGTVELTVTGCKFLTATSKVYVNNDRKKDAAGKRAVYVNGGAKINVESTEFDDKVYAYNGGNQQTSWSFENSYLKGWMSGNGNFAFENCQFGSSGVHADFVPYGDATFKDCDFERGFAISLKKSAEKTLTFDKYCTYNGSTIEEPLDMNWSYNGGSASEKANVGITNIKIGKNKWKYEVVSEENDAEFDEDYFEEAE